MKVAIIQLSDIHFSNEKDLICSRHEAFCRSCKYLINECSKVIFVISGDIANYGTKEQYDLAYHWLKNCETFWRKNQGLFSLLIMSLFLEIMIVCFLIAILLEIW